MEEYAPYFDLPYEEYMQARRQHCENSIKLLIKESDSAGQEMLWALWTRQYYKRMIEKRR